MNTKKILPIVVASIIVVVGVACVAYKLGTSKFKPVETDVPNIGTTGVTDEEKNVFSEIQDNLLCEIQEVFSNVESIRSYEFNEDDDYCYLGVTDNNNNSYDVVYNKASETFTWEYINTSNTPVTRPLDVSEDNEEKEEEKEPVIIDEDTLVDEEPTEEQEEVLRKEDFTTEEIVSSPDLWFTFYKDWMLEQVTLIDSSVKDISVTPNVIDIHPSAHIIYVVSDVGDIYFVLYEPFSDNMYLYAINPDTDFVPAPVLEMPGLKEEYIGMATEPYDFSNVDVTPSPKELLKQEIKDVTDWTIYEAPAEVQDNIHDIDRLTEAEFGELVLGFIPASYKIDGDRYIIFALLENGMVERLSVNADATECDFQEVGKYKELAPKDYICQNKDILWACYRDWACEYIRERESNADYIYVAKYEYRGFEEAYILLGMDVDFRRASIDFKGNTASIMLQRY